MSIEEEIKEIKQSLTEATDKILHNMNELHSQKEQINTNSNNIQKNSYALEILKDYKRESKRLFIALLVMAVMWFLTAGFLVYVLVK